MSGRVLIDNTVVTYDGTDPETAKIVSVENEGFPGQAAYLMEEQPRPEKLEWMYGTREVQVMGFEPAKTKWIPPAPITERGIH